MKFPRVGPGRVRDFKNFHGSGRVTGHRIFLTGHDGSTKIFRGSARVNLNFVTGHHGSGTKCLHFFQKSNMKDFGALLMLQSEYFWYRSYQFSDVMAYELLLQKEIT